MRKNIKEARTAEGKYNPEVEVDPKDRALAILNAEEPPLFPNIKLDDDFDLPYGFGYDWIIKQKAELIQDRRFYNNKVMDRLVEQLGYLDYRDMLAANKYILEAKAAEGYKSAARAKALSIGFSRMTKLKRERIE